MQLNHVLVGLTFVFAASLAAADDDERRSCGQDIVVGKSYMLSSEVLGEDRTIKVSLPEGYENSARSYPTIYMLEGHWFFSFGVNMQARMADQENVPPAIIVGMQMANPARFGHLRAGSENADRMLDFLEDEVFAFMTKNFRVSDRRTLMGWEFGGGFAVHTLVKRPHMFDAFIAASPYPLSAELLDFSVLDKLADKPMWADKFLYFGVSEHEGEVNEGVGTLTSALQEKKPRGLKWEQKLLSGDELTIRHRLTAYPLFLEGLSKSYADYRPLKFDGEAGKAKLKALGGFGYVKAYSTARAKKYGTPDRVASNTSFAFMRMARATDDIELFDQFVKGADIYYGRWSPYWYHRFAQFYIKHGKLEDGVLMYQQTLRIFPSALEATIGLAGAYEAGGQKEKALATYQKAAELAEQQDSPQLNEIRDKLVSLTS